VYFLAIFVRFRILKKSSYLKKKPIGIPNYNAHGVTKII
jgi:hypothetical protein